MNSNTASGVILANGSHFGGWRFFLDDGVPTVGYALSTKPSDITRIAARQSLAPGKTRINFVFECHGGVGAGATVSILAGSDRIGSGQIERTTLTTAGLGESIDIERDTGVPVTDYRGFEGCLSGTIEWVTLTFE